MFALETTGIVVGVVGRKADASRRAAKGSIGGGAVGAGVPVSVVVVVVPIVGGPAETIGSCPITDTLFESLITMWRVCRSAFRSYKGRVSARPFKVHNGETEADNVPVQAQRYFAAVRRHS